MHSEIPFTQIFREINFRNCRGLKSATLTHLEDLNFGFYEFLHVLKGEISPNQKLRASEMAEMAFYELLHSSKLIQRKIWVTENAEISTLCDDKILSFSQCRFFLVKWNYQNL